MKFGANFSVNKALWYTDIVSLVTNMRLKKLNQTAQFQIRPGYWVLFFTLLGFGLRLQQISFQPLWGDEGWSFYFAVQSVPQLLALTAIDIHPPLYYLLLKIWMLVTGLGPEEARLFSVAVGTMLIPTVAVLGQRLANKRIGAAAAAVTAIMPLAVYYSQEVRMYILVTLLGCMSTYFFIKNENWSSKYLPAYLITTAAALYTMYYAVFIVAFQFLYAVLVYLRRAHRPKLFEVLKPFIIVGLLYLPWIVYAAPKLASYISNKRDVEGYVPLNLLSFLGDHFVTFSLGHLPDALQPYIWFVLPAALLVVLGFGAVHFLKNRQVVLLYFYLFVPLLLGFMVNLIYPFTPRFFERTLLLVAPAFWLFMAIGLVWLWHRQSILAVVTSVLVLITITVSLIGFYTVPRYPEEDYRPLLRDIAARATPQDTLLGSYQWQLGFYHAYLPAPRPKLYPVPGWGAGWSAQDNPNVTLTADLEAIFAESPRLWFPAYQAGGHIWEDQAEAAIATLGYPALLEWYSPQTKLTLAGAAQSPQTEPISANFENRLMLLSATVGGQSYQAGRDVVPVELLWKKVKSMGSEHRVSLRLVDSSGRTWATRDSLPQANQASFTEINLGDTLPDRHGLLTPAGAPPGTYRLLLSVRRLEDYRPLNLLDANEQPMGAELQLAEVTLVPPDPPVSADALPVQTYTNAIFDTQAKLVGYSLGAGSFKAGEPLPLILFWESLGDAPGPLTIQVDLKDSAEETVANYQQPPIWPSTEWQQGSILRDPHDLLLPPTLPPGQYQLSLAVLSPQQEPLSVNNGDHLTLETISTIDRPRVFEAPAPQFETDVNFSGQIRLVGLDLPKTQVKAGQVLPLTLHWQAVDTPDRSWTVFVHLTDKEGNIVSQQDQIPGAGQFPTTGWLADEYLADSYSLQIPVDTPAGEDAYFLKVGLYDANNFSRLPVVENEKIIGDHVTIESWPISIE